MLSVLRLLTQRLVAAGSLERRAIEVRASVYVCVWVSIAAPVLRPPPLHCPHNSQLGFLGVSDPPPSPSPSSHHWSTIPEPGPAHKASAAAAAAPLRFPSNTLPPLCTPASLDYPARVCASVWHSACSVWTPRRRKNLSGGAQLGLCRGKKRGPVVRRWRGVRVFHWSGSAAGAPASQTSERAPSGRSGGRIYITHADTGKH